MNYMLSLLFILVPFLFYNAASYPLAQNDKDDGRLSVSCRNLPDSIRIENLLFQLFSDKNQIENIKKFVQTDRGFCEIEEDTNLLSGLYNTKLTGLFEYEIMIKDVEIKAGFFTFLNFDYKVLKSIRQNNDNSSFLVIDWEEISPKIYKDKCTVDQK
ncbi:hypothetical protein G3O08_08880 [Cryomorpha ignava]|uniref:Uncharacterized protein n=1 Tax=Cryomorpha ignava TaxID=101383 RepID=A0A7K3WQ46_9FLAO|nr:hypothetical protein [Cryomorpha ignava]NEN23614.1 hypothetical protein [Cryomorpha ignava]